MTVRTRFAPSPTGYLHIGGVRTALFNWLFARRHGGQFILRIDDTDQERNVAAALQPILDGFKWLGIDWDEGPEVGGPHEPYYQSQRADRYAEAVQKLLAGGFAYKDYATTDEIQAERDAAMEAGEAFTYSRRFLAETADDEKRFEAEGRSGVVRLKMPRAGSLVLEDLVRGRVEFGWANEQDHVIQRADGSCLYHLATVVDDADFAISHVIRAEEHLPNTPRQVFIAQSLGYELPKFAHLPYVAEPGGKSKLSKRKLAKYLTVPAFQLLHAGALKTASSWNSALKAASAALELPPNSTEREELLEEFLTMAESHYKARSKDETQEVKDIMRHLLETEKNLLKNPAILDSLEHGQKIVHMLGIHPGISLNPVLVDFYEQVGYLPQAVVNYLVLLGWSLDDATEFFAREEMIEHFSLERVNKAPASFDPAKLLAFQEHYMNRLDLKKKTALCLPFLQRAKLVADPPPCDTGPYLSRILESAGDRLKVAGDVLDYADFFLADEELEYDEKALEKRIHKPADAAGLLAKFKERLATVEPFDPPTLEALLGEFVEAEGIKVGQIIHAIRVAVTGKPVGFGLFETLAILGRERCLERIDRALAAV